MKTVFKCISGVAIILFLSHCKKKDVVYNAYFYTSNLPADGNLGLYIDGRYKGELPHLGVKPSCGNDSLKRLALFMKLEDGRYKVEAIDRSGTVKSASTVKFRRNRTSCSGGIGGSEITALEDCLIVGLSY